MRLQWRAIWFMDKGGFFSQDFMTNLRRLKVWSVFQVLHLHLAAVYGNLKRGSQNGCQPKGRRTSLSFEKRKTLVTVVSQHSGAICTDELSNNKSLETTEGSLMTDKCNYE